MKKYKKSNERILITLVIDDEETVENYKDCDPEYIMVDLRDGSLIDACEMVSVVVDENKC